MRLPQTGNGFCRMGTDAVVARSAPHLWEEPCISGTRGTGAVFFSGCTLGCSYCQNRDISHDNRGTNISAGELADCFRRLYKQDVHSLSLITPTHFLPAVCQALDMYHPAIPLVYNCGGYESKQTVQALEGMVDVWLPDLKCVSPTLGRKLLGRGDYFDHAGPAVLEMCRQSGRPLYNSEGILIKGTLVRHLIIPGCITDSLQVLRFIADELPKGTPVSLMCQYTPMSGGLSRDLRRRLRADEYRRVLDAAQDLGLHGYMQDAASADSAYTPLFDGTGV